MCDMCVCVSIYIYIYIYIYLLGLHHLVGRKFVMKSASMTGLSFIPLPALVMDSIIDF